MYYRKSNCQSNSSAVSPLSPIGWVEHRPRLNSRQSFQGTNQLPAKFVEFFVTTCPWTLGTTAARHNRTHSSQVWFLSRTLNRPSDDHCGIMVALQSQASMENEPRFYHCCSSLLFKFFGFLDSFLRIFAVLKRFLYFSTAFLLFYALPLP